MNAKQCEELLKLINTVSVHVFGYTACQSGKKYVFKDTDGDLVHITKKKYAFSLSDIGAYTVNYAREVLNDFPVTHKDYTSNMPNIEKLESVLEGRLELLETVTEKKAETVGNIENFKQQVFKKYRVTSLNDLRKVCTSAKNLDLRFKDNWKNLL